MSEKTVESKVADTILQRIEDVKVGTETYSVAPPSCATLIIASEAISALPGLKMDSSRVIEEVLKNAKDCRAIGDVVAVLILGAKHLTETVKVVETRYKRVFLGIFKKPYEVEVETVVDRRAELARLLLEELTPHELYRLALQLLGRMQVSDFFGLTTFLVEINTTRPTKVETETTASGQ